MTVNIQPNDTKDKKETKEKETKEKLPVPQENGKEPPKPVPITATSTDANISYLLFLKHNETNKKKKFFQKPHFILFF